MVHEAMVLEYAGPTSRWSSWAAAMRLTVLLGAVASLFVPWGIATTAPRLQAASARSRSPPRSPSLGVALAAAEVFMAKLRLFRVPELLAGVVRARLPGRHRVLVPAT